MNQNDVPSWRLPQGVTRSLWQYAQAPHIANDYDEYFRNNSLFDFDESLLTRYFDKPGWLADLGCGTGRLLVPFARRGFRGLAVDLSMHMLTVVGNKASAENLPIDRLRANMVELDCLADASIDYCICMFSTLGMIRSHENRSRVLSHVRRVLKPGGTFVLHVHNRWHHLFNPQGRRWLVGGLASAITRRGHEPGDKVFDYRGIPQMALHAFTRRELVSMLRRAGLTIVELVPLDTERRHRLRHAWFFERLRAMVGSPFVGKGCRAFARVVCYSVMADETADLEQKLRDLHQQLRKTSNLPPETRAMLLGIVADIERALQGEESRQGSIAERLAEAGREFEGQHPTLTGTIGSVIDALSRMGI